MSFLRYQLQSSPPIQAGPTQIILRSRLFELRLPWNSLRWNRPHSVLVREDGAERVLPVFDVTRQVVVMTAAAVLLFAFVFLRRKP